MFSLLRFLFIHETSAAVTYLNTMTVLFNTCLNISLFWQIVSS